MQTIQATSNRSLINPPLHNHNHTKILITFGSDLGLQLVHHRKLSFRSMIGNATVDTTYLRSEFEHSLSPPFPTATAIYCNLQAPSGSTGSLYCGNVTDCCGIGIMGCGATGF